MADVLGKKISELAETTDLAGLYTIGSDKNNQSKKVSLQMLKEAADYANAQGDYAKTVGDTVQGNTGVNEYPVFSASKQYAAGDVVLYDGRLYKFTALHAAGAWIGTDAVETSIKDQTDSKLAELSANAIYSLTPICEEIANSWVNNDGGFKATSKDISIYTLKNERFAKIKTRVAGDSASFCAIAFYRGDSVSEENFISGVTGNIGWHDYVADIPAECDLIAVTHQNTFGGYETKPLIFIDELTPFEELNKANRIDLTSVAVSTDGTWLRYQDGAIVQSGNYLVTHKVSVKGLSLIATLTYLSDTSSAAIAFFGKNDTYLKEASIQGKATGENGESFIANVPTDAEYAIICSNSRINPNMPSIYTIGGGQYLMNELQKQNERIFNVEWTPMVLANGEDAWIRYSNGEYVPSTATKTFFFKTSAFSRIRVFLKSDTTIICAVAFYSDVEPTQENYLTSSIAWKGSYPNGEWYDVEIPSEAKMFAVTSNTKDGFVPLMQVLSYEYQYYQDERIDNIETLAKKDIPNRGDIVLASIGDIYHFGMSAVSSRDENIEVPSQSIFDIRYAKALGYKVIEANLHKTSDGKYVTTHGQSGALGHDFDDLSGNDAYGVVIANYTLEYLRNNYRYHSTIEGYRVPITTLEEFCAEAKRCGIIVMLQYVDNVSLNIARQILGDRLLFMYNAPRSVYNGAILEYRKYSTIEEIISRCNEVGSPYIYSMANPESFTEEQLKEIALELHKRGSYLASAYMSSNYANRLKGYGFDFFAMDGKAKYLASNQTIIDSRKVTFNADGSVSWESL